MRPNPATVEGIMESGRSGGWVEVSGAVAG
jgi:hypothetical protein